MLIHKIAPSHHLHHSNRLAVPGTSDIETIEKYAFHLVLFGEYQLTTACASVAQKMHANSEDGVVFLEGLIPVAEDKHTKIFLLGGSELYMHYLFGHMLT